jgi:hypothetical protein
LRFISPELDCSGFGGTKDGFSVELFLGSPFRESDKLFGRKILVLSDGISMLTAENMGEDVSFS